MIQKELEDLWKQFWDTPINEDEEIEEDFHIWSKGTDRMQIWDWFDEKYPEWLAVLMNVYVFKPQKDFEDFLVAQGKDIKTFSEEQMKDEEERYWHWQLEAHEQWLISDEELQSVDDWYYIC